MFFCSDLVQSAARLGTAKGLGPVARGQNRLAIVGRAGLGERQNEIAMHLPPLGVEGGWYASRGSAEQSEGFPRIEVSEWGGPQT